MKESCRTTVLVTIVGLWALAASPVMAADPPPGNWGTCIFSNSVNDLSIRFDPGTRQVGDQIILAGTDRYVHYFDFEYWGWNTANPSFFAGNVQADVRFYLNDGSLFHGYASPGTLLWDSGWFGGLTPTGPSPGFRATIYFEAGSDNIPNNGVFIGQGTTPANEMTWTVQFRGMGATDTVGVDLYSPPTVGQDYPDYWEYNGGWLLMTNSAPMDFGARLYATPEPSSLVLSLVGGLGILTLVRRRREN